MRLADANREKTWARESQNCGIFAFDEVERKPNSDLWLSGVGFPL